MNRRTITGVDDFTATSLTDLWNRVSHSMIEGLAADICHAKAEGTLTADELKILDDTERTLRSLDNGEQHGSPRVLRNAVQAWLAYYFRSAEEPVGMPLGPVYRLAAELSDLSEVLERAERDALPNDPWAPAKQECHNHLCGLANKDLVHVDH